MKEFSKNIKFFVLPLMMGIVLIFLIPVDKNFVYHFVKGECNNKASWIYERIFEEKKNIDIAFMGASHTSCAIMDEYIENQLSSLSAKETGVANLGYCRSGRDIQYVMLKDLFLHKNPKILVLEVMEDEAKKSHPVFPYLAESDDLWSSLVFFNQRFLVNIWKGIIVRFEQLKFHLFQTPDSTFQNINSFGYLPSNQIVHPGDIRQNERNWENRLARTKPGFIKNVESSYSKHYIEKMVKLATENQCKVLFLYLPESGSNLKLPVFNDYYSKLSEVIILPDSIVSNKSNWKDATHFNDSGALQTSDFICTFLLDIL